MTKNLVINSFDTSKLIKQCIFSKSPTRRFRDNRYISEAVIDNRIKMLYISAKELSILNSYNVKYIGEKIDNNDADSINLKDYSVEYNKNHIFSAFDNIKNISDIITQNSPKADFSEKIKNIINNKLNIKEIINSFNLIFNNSQENFYSESPSYEFFEKYRKQILDKEFSTKCSFGGLSVHISDSSFGSSKPRHQNIDQDIKDLQRILGFNARAT